MTIKQATESARSKAKAHGPSWACPTCGATHLYDCPNIGPVGFLQAVMHDATVSIRDRIRAANTSCTLRTKVSTPMILVNHLPSSSLSSSGRNE